MLGLSRPAPGHTKCTVYGDVPYAPGPTRAAVTSLNSTIRVWPERHQAQSCAIALRPPASDPLSTYLIPPPIVFGSAIEVQCCIWMPIQIQRRSLATRCQPKEQARDLAQHSPLPPHSRASHLLGRSLRFLCAGTQALPLGDLKSACQYGASNVALCSFEAN